MRSSSVGAVKCTDSLANKAIDSGGHCDVDSGKRAVCTYIAASRPCAGLVRMREHRQVLDRKSFCSDGIGCPRLVRKGG